MVTEDDVRRAPEERRATLEQNVGRPICSVLSELEQLSARPSEELPVQPAVSFVSMIAGLLAAAELVKYAARLGSPLETFFQIDSMYPLSNAFLQPVEKVKSCYCGTRAEEVRRYRRIFEGG